MNQYGGTSEASPEYSQKPFFFEMDGGSNMCSCFSENWIARLLKASVLDKVDCIYTFPVPIVDAFCGTDNSASVSSDVTKFVDPINFTSRNDGKLFRIVRELSTLLQNRSDFKATTMRPAGVDEWIRSKMQELHWSHCGKHCGDNVVEYVHTGIFIDHDRVFKAFYRAASQHDEKQRQ